MAEIFKLVFGINGRVLNTDELMENLFVDLKIELKSQGILANKVTSSPDWLMHANFESKKFSIAGTIYNIEPGRWSIELLNETGRLLKDEEIYRLINPTLEKVVFQSSDEFTWVQNGSVFRSYVKGGKLL